MITGDELISKLDKNKKHLEFQIKYYKLFNIRNKIILFLIENGIRINRVSPYVLSGIILCIINNSIDGGTLLDSATKYENIETIDTSTGEHLRSISFDSEYNEKLEYSTGWQKNDNDSFYRVETRYYIDDNFYSKSVEEILSMSKEEIEEVFEISDIEVIIKDILDESDKLYNNDSIIVTTTTVDLDNTQTSFSITKENIINLTFLALFTIISGKICSKVLFKKQKNIIEKSLREIKKTYKLVQKEDLKIQHNVLYLMNQNIKMLNENSQNIPNYQLRKKRGYYEQ